MELISVEKDGIRVALAQGGAPFLTDVQSALDLIAAVQYEAQADRVVLRMENLPAEFFRLGTGLAGEVLQKFINYGTKLAVVGDFGRLRENSAPLNAFLEESNRGNDVFFVGSEEEAVARLLGAR